MSTAIEETLKRLAQLVGTWTTEATHPALPGVIVRGSAVIEWLEGERFLVHRARVDHPQFPDSISMLGFTERDRVGPQHERGVVVADDAKLSMHYYDSRGVFRSYDASIDERAWRWWRDTPGFSQRFTGTFADGGATIVGRSELCEDDVHWSNDLAITYRRS